MCSTTRILSWRQARPLLIRRQVRADGGSKAFINDQPVGVALLRAIAPFLVELHGQHDDRGLVNPRGHLQLVDRLRVPRPVSWRGFTAAGIRPRRTSSMCGRALNRRKPNRTCCLLI
jgi:hypothetical protein